MRHRVISTSTTEDKIKRNFDFVHKLHLRTLRSRYRNSDQKHWFKARRSTSVFRNRKLINSACRNKRSALSQISSNERSVHLILSESCSSLLVRRAICTNLVVVRGRFTSSANTITVPRSNLCHTQRIINSHLPKRIQPKFDSRNTNLIEKACNVGILWRRSKNIPHTYVCAS